MHVAESILRLAAGDLGRFVACRHLTELDRKAAEGQLTAPVRHDPILELLKQRGFEHEEAYVEHLRGQGLDVVVLRDVEGDEAESRTLAAMQSGAEVIVQARLRDGRWMGIADVLLRVEEPSELGAWSYEVVDTKLAQETRGATVLQLCLYSDLVGRIQARDPAHFHVVKPGDGLPQDTYRFADFRAYYRFVRDRLENAIDGPPSPDTYPYPVEQCNICRWWAHCKDRRRADDHLSLVAGIRRMQTVELEDQGIVTLTEFAEEPTPLRKKPRRGSEETFAAIQEQARVQLEGRREAANVYKLIEPEAGRGLARLPAPDAGDVYFDIEGDRFFPEGGLEYLFGYAYAHDGGDLVYEKLWASSRVTERLAFEKFVDFVIERWAHHADMHVYHYAPYEPGAMKRLASRHATREAEVDRLLRGGRFVDLYAVTRQGVRASVDRYSIKDLEPFFGFERAVDLRDASAALRRAECTFELGTEVTDADRELIEGYNRDDCLATAGLQNWLERLRGELLEQGHPLDRPVDGDGSASEGAEERQAEVQEVFDRLVGELPADRTAWTDTDDARWLLAHQLEYFGREKKVGWWEFFRLQDLGHEECFDDPAVLAGLEFVGEQEGGTARCPIHRYRFPPQEIKLDGDDLYEVGQDMHEIGSKHDIDPVHGTIDIKKRQKARDEHPTEVFGHTDIPSGALTQSLLLLGQWVGTNGIDAPGDFRAARDLLLKRRPRLGDQRPGPLRRTEESTIDAATRLVRDLDHSVLAIQGPPGTGKTYTGAHVIAERVRAGKRVGVTAVSHKVIRKLLEESLKAAQQTGAPIEAVHKSRDESEDLPDGLEVVSSNGAALDALDAGKVVGGTAWLWARDDAEATLDYLFVDEAGQMSLATTLAASRAARNVILLGDPQQLEQPQKGAHPEGADVAALLHMLDGHKTIPDEQGLFLDTTWRMHPKICSFTSELYYEDRLLPREGLELQAVTGATPFAGSGMFYVPVDHEGNQNQSEEEVEAIVRIVESLLETCSGWTDANGAHHELNPDDILVVAPYNAQVATLSERLSDVAVGTVDKFQGQQAPVVIYSVTSSSGEDAPRGLGFLYSPNRLNVATSRARCACILVASPRIFAAECRTPEQMRWVNGLCRFREMARQVSIA